MAPPLGGGRACGRGRVGCGIGGPGQQAQLPEGLQTAFDLDVPAPPSITATGATATLTTPLTWTAPAGVSVVHFDRRDSTGLVVGTLDVAAASTSVTFPDLTALGAQVLPGSALEWHVETWGGVTSTDALAAATGFGALLACTVDFTHGVSDSSTVTISR